MELETSVRYAAGSARTARSRMGLRHQPTEQPRFARVCPRFASSDEKPAAQLDRHAVDRHAVVVAGVQGAAAGPDGRVDAVHRR